MPAQRILMHPLLAFALEQSVVSLAQALEMHEAQEHHPDLLDYANPQRPLSLTVTIQALNDWLAKGCRPTQ